MNLVGRRGRALQVEGQVMASLVAQRQETAGKAWARVLAVLDRRPACDEVALLVEGEILCLRAEHPMAPPRDYFAHLDANVRELLWQCERIPGLAALVQHLAAWQAERERAECEGREVPPCPPIDLPARDPRQVCALLAAAYGWDEADLWGDYEALLARDPDEVWAEFVQEMRGA